MLKATFIVPRRDNDGASLDTQRNILEADLLNTFGGFSQHHGDLLGMWMERDTRNVYFEKSACYFVVIEDAQLACLKELLFDFKSRTRQRSIYLDICPVTLEFL